jgi:hypothetical protein
MSDIPKRQTVVIPYYDTKIKQYQLKQNGSPVDLTGQTLIFYVKSLDNSNFTPIEKDVGNEGWIDDAQSGQFHVVIDTAQYSMVPGRYQAEIEWEDQKTSLVFLDITVTEDIRHTP